MIENSIWNEKYRCKKLEEFVCSEEYRKDFEKYISSNDIPHMLLVGKAGVGKTTLAKLLCSNMKCDSLMINASDENGIDIIREKVKTFASSATFQSIKIVVLDEADFLTSAAQAALRNIIESFSKKTRFILTCNYVEKIIEPLQSRCTTYLLTPPTKGEVCKRFVEILDNENVKYNIQDVAKIIENSYPDIRQGINILQKSSLDGNLNITKEFNSNYVEQIINVLSSKNTSAWKDIRQIIADNGVRDFEDIYKALYEKYSTTSLEMIPIISDSLYKQAFVIDKEICFMAMIYQIIEKQKKLIYG